MSAKKPPPFTEDALRELATVHASKGVPWVLALAKAETELREKAKYGRIRNHGNGDRPVYVRNENK